MCGMQGAGAKSEPSSLGNAHPSHSQIFSLLMEKLNQVKKLKGVAFPEPLP